MKANHYIMVFLRSFLSFFVLWNSPMDDLRNEYRDRRDADSIAEDWKKVGQDISYAYEEGKQAC